MVELEGTRWPEPSILWSIKLSFTEFFMHNLIPHNQLSGSEQTFDPHSDLLAEYYECLIDCEDTASSCKRICKEVLV